MAPNMTAFMASAQGLRFFTATYESTCMHSRCHRTTDGHTSTDMLAHCTACMHFLEATIQRGTSTICTYAGSTAPYGSTSSWSTLAAPGAVAPHCSRFQAWLLPKRAGKISNTASLPTFPSARARFAPHAPWYVMRRLKPLLVCSVPSMTHPWWQQASRLRQDSSIMPSDLPPQPASRCSSAPTQWPVPGLWQSNCLQVACTNACTQQTVVRGNMCQAACGVC